MKLTTFHTDAHGPVDISIDDTGHFTATVDDAEYSSDTLLALKTQLQKAKRQAALRISIPFHRLDRHTGKILAGTIVGRHAANNNLLVKIEGARGTSQDTSWGGSEYLSLDPVELVELARLRRVDRDASKALDAFLKRHTFDGKKKTDAALDAALTALGALP